MVGGLILAALAAGVVLASNPGASQPPAEADAHPGALHPAGVTGAAPPGRLQAARPVSGGTREAGRSLVQRLSRDQLAGQRVIYAYAGLKPPASLLAAIRAGEAAGVIFYGPNISSSSQIRAVVGELQRASASSLVHAPLLMLTDQEGGEVRRLPGAPILSEKQIGESASAVAQARDAGVGAGRNLAGVGINANLAPVLDVFRQPGNFIDEFQRSYAANPSTVARLGAAFIKAQQRTGVAATAKHFPGLGAATQGENTDLAPVTLDVSLRHLRTVDEAPYRSAIAAGVKLVMTSWAIYPALDPLRPAGLSPTVIGGELRGRLGFRGVTITDGIDAGAVTPLGGLARRGVLAAGAGADLILCAATNVNDNTPAQGITVLHAIASALGHHQLSLVAAQQAASRVLALRSQP
jgi:beta-N-acetylhexosaminidase